MTAAGVPAGVVRGWLRERRAAAARKRLGTLMFRLYLASLYGVVPFVILAREAVGRRPLELSPADVAAVAPYLGGGLPALLAIACLVVLRSAVWRGPVVVAPGDVAFLLTMPVPRAAVLRPRMAAALSLGAAAGAGLGALLWLVLAALLPAAPGPLAAATVGAGALLGVTATGTGWAVETDPRLARGLVRATVALVALAAAVAAIPALGPVARWSGPWGWAAAPILAAAGLDAPGWPVALVLLAAAAAALAVRSWRGAGDVTLEQLRLRAGTADRMATAANMLDRDALTRTGREAVVALLGPSRVRLPRPRHRAVLVGWIGATLLLRNRQVLWQALGWVTATAAVLAGRVLGGPAFLWVAAAAVPAYAAAVALMEPLRIERDQGFAARTLPWHFDALVLRHVALPAVLTALLGAAAGATAATFLQADPAAAAIAGALPAPGLVVAAAWSTVRPPPDNLLLLYGEAGAQQFLAQSSAGLAAGAALALPGAALALSALRAPMPWPSLQIAAAAALVPAALALAALRGWLRSR